MQIKNLFLRMVVYGFVSAIIGIVAGFILSFLIIGLLTLVGTGNMGGDLSFINVLGMGAGAVIGGVLGGVVGLKK